MFRPNRTAAVLAVLGAFAALPVHAVQRTFVASYGNDANTATNCNFANPCRSFQVALSVTDPGGEIIALDAAGYGVVNITKSVTIAANPGFHAGISAAAGNAVTIATASVEVILRGLNINGTGGTNGVLMTNGAQLSVENCVISNFSQVDGSGVRVSVQDATVRIVDSMVRENYWGVLAENGANVTIGTSKFLGNTDVGVWVHGTTATTTTVAIGDSVFTNPNSSVLAASNFPGAVVRASVIRSTLSNSTFGPAVDSTGGTATLTISDNLVMGNQIAFFQQGAGATLESAGNNTIRQNGPGIGTITPVGTM